MRVEDLGFRAPTLNPHDYPQTPLPPGFPFLAFCRNTGTEAKRAGSEGGRAAGADEAQGREGGGPDREEPV